MLDDTVIIAGSVIGLAIAILALIITVNRADRQLRELQHQMRRTQALAISIREDIQKAKGRLN